VSEHEPQMAEGLVEFLQITAPQWATKLTLERLAWVNITVALGREHEAATDLLAEILDRGMDVDCRKRVRQFVHKAKGDQA